MVFLPLFYMEIREYFKACGSLAAVLFYVFLNLQIISCRSQASHCCLLRISTGKAAYLPFLMSAMATSSNVVLGRYLELIRLINVLHCLLKARLITGMDCFGIRLIA